MSSSSSGLFSKCHHRRNRNNKNNLPSLLKLQPQQRRSYWFIPVSWPEFVERFQRWIERTEQRIVRVTLLKRNGLQQHIQHNLNGSINSTSSVYDHNQIGIAGVVLPEQQLRQQEGESLLNLPQTTSRKPWERRKRKRKHPIYYYNGRKQNHAVTNHERRRWRVVPTPFANTATRASEIPFAIIEGNHNNPSRQQQQQQQLMLLPLTVDYIPLPSRTVSSTYATSSHSNNDLPTALEENHSRITTNTNHQQRSKTSPSSSKVQELRTKYQGWKLRRKEQYDGWKLRRKEQYDGWKLRRKEQYDGWKTRRRQQYDGWKLRRKEQYQGWKSRRQQLYDGWRDQRREKWTVRKHRALEYLNRKILLQEYSLPEWFDEYGRPVTSKDSTGRFVNPWQSQSTNGVHSLGTLLRWRWQRLERELRQIGLIGMVMDILPWTTRPPSSSPLAGQTVPPLPNPIYGKLQYTWIGHATGLLHVEKDFTILVDPMFSVRASPYQNSPIGVARDVPPAFTIDELVNQQRINQQQQQQEQRIKDEEDGEKPNLTSRNDHNTNNGHHNDDYLGKFDICCITHDHYDHMDTNSILVLKDHIQLWVVPLGIKEWLSEKCHIDNDSIVELEWWQQIRVRKSNNNNKVIIVQEDDGKDTDSHNHDDHHNSQIMTITCCPASHWAGRTMWDRNFRLWCSFAFRSPSFNFFYCGDTGYPEGFPLFHQIGDVLGPFDFCVIPIAAYEPEELNKDAHINPREAVQVHKDLRSRQSVAIHWGSFQLSEEPMDAPPRDLHHAIQEETENDPSTLINFSVLNHGETFEVECVMGVSVSTTDAMVTTAANGYDDVTNSNYSRESGDDEEEVARVSL
jgi:N-acyl-phosphatidylethanolamine-hydrolysing phospholipase D